MLVPTSTGFVEVRRIDYATDRDYYRAVRFFRTT
jgi:hypothetical protein